MTFTRATTIEEAVTAMAAGARPIAGGSDLVVGARQGKAPLPDVLVAIDRIDDLRGIETSGQGLRVGAGVTHAELIGNETVVSSYTAVADAAALVGSPATRNVGTIGGNVMNASPAMDTGAPLLVLDGHAVLKSVDGSRSVNMADLWTGPGRTSADPGELCVAIELPPQPERSGSAYVRLEYRRAMEIAVVGAAAAVTVSEDGTIETGRVALTAVGPAIIEVADASVLMSGRDAKEAGAAAETAASKSATPISDLRAGDDYRRHTVGVMARRAVKAAAARARGETIAVPVNRSAGVGAAS